MSGEEVNESSAPQSSAGRGLGIDWQAIEGWLTTGEGEKLIELAKDADVLEIGSYCGRSTVAMSSVAKHIVCVDPFDSSAIEPHPVRDTWKTFLENTRFVRCPITPMIARIENVARFLNSNTFDMVFVDGDHKFDPCVRDIRIASRLVKPGGVIVIHDYGTGYAQLQEVTKAVDQVIGRSFITQHESLAIWRSP